jgi:hypothetical protein
VTAAKRLTTNALQALAWREGVQIYIDNAKGVAECTVRGKTYEASLHDERARGAER